MVLIHTVFDLLAACAALGMTLFVYNWRLKAAGRKIDSAGPLYGVALLAGAAIGGFGAGTLNLHLSGEPGIGRSIVGALAGAGAVLGGKAPAAGVWPACAGLGLAWLPGRARTKAGVLRQAGSSSTTTSRAPSGQTRPTGVEGAVRMGVAAFWAEQEPLRVGEGAGGDGLVRRRAGGRAARRALSLSRRPGPPSPSRRDFSCAARHN